jgi:hypothetical protein
MAATTVNHRAIAKRSAVALSASVLRRIIP